MFGIYDPQEAYVGTCGLTSISNNHKTAEYSLLIGPEHQGKGYGTAALTKLINYAFNDLNLERIEGEIYETNEGSIKIAEKLGFKKEGVLRSRYYKEGQRINTFMYGLLRNEWKS